MQKRRLIKKKSTLNTSDSERYRSTASITDGQLPQGQRKREVLNRTDWEKSLSEEFESQNGSFDGNLGKLYFDKSLYFDNAVNSI